MNSSIMIKRLFLAMFICSMPSLLSCSRTNRLSEEDFSWMPYRGDETLVLKSNFGETDTISFIRKDTLWGYPDPALSTSKNEIIGIFCKHSDPYALSYRYRYLESYFIKIEKTGSRYAEMVVNLSAKDAKFYRRSPIRIDSLSKEKPVTFQTADAQYNDVYIFRAEGDFQERNNYVTQVYWSKSHGLIRYDKKDGIYWEVSKMQ